jgi:hypothetical protein
LRSTEERAELAEHAMALSGRFLESMNSAANPGVIDCGGAFGWHVGTFHFAAQTLGDRDSVRGTRKVQREPEPLFLLTDGRFATVDPTSRNASPPRRRGRSKSAAPSLRLIVGSHRLGMPMVGVGVNPWLQLNASLPRIAAEHGLAL